MTSTSQPIYGEFLEKLEAANQVARNELGTKEGEYIPSETNLTISMSVEAWEHIMQILGESA